MAVGVTIIWRFDWGWRSAPKEADSHGRQTGADWGFLARCVQRLESVPSLTATDFPCSMQSERPGEGAFYDLAREVMPPAPPPAIFYEVYRPALMHCGRGMDKAG